MRPPYRAEEKDKQISAQDEEDDNNDTTYNNASSSYHPRTLLFGTFLVVTEVGALIKRVTMTYCLLQNVYPNIRVCDYISIDIACLNTWGFARYHFGLKRSDISFNANASMLRQLQEIYG